MSRPSPRVYEGAARNSQAVAALVASIWSVGGAGCAGLEGTSVPNAPPDTKVTATAPVLEQTGPIVEFFWTGYDPDGAIAAFQWRISDNGADGLVTPADTLGLPWHTTAATDSSFAVTADLDSLPIDVADPGLDSATYRAWQTHTFFVRAIDDRGSLDPTPAAVSFTATTLTPTVRIDLPRWIESDYCSDAPLALSFGWVGADQDSPSGLPAESRWVLWPLAECLTEHEFNTRNPLAALPDDRWQPWVPYDGAGGAGKRVTLPRQSRGTVYLFAVQVRDAAGAITPTLEWGVNVREVNITGTHRPRLFVHEAQLGDFAFEGTTQVQPFPVVAGQPLQFTWRAEADHYGGVIESYRYGWEVVDPAFADDPGWAVGWGNGPPFLGSSRRSFSQGSPNFVVQVRDNSGAITRGVFQFEVIQIEDRNNQRDLLLVQDWTRADTDTERRIDAAWDLAWEQILSGHLSGFDPAVDMLDLHDDPEGLTFRAINRYKSVIYFVRGSSVQTAFHSLLTPGGVDEVRYNWFQVYQSRVGNVLFTGPSAMYGTVEWNVPGAGWKFPIVFNSPEAPPNGFGVVELPDGLNVPRGTQRFPYQAFCLEAVDIVRPDPGSIPAERAVLLRTKTCDAMARALVDSDFMDRYPSAAGFVVDLEPIADRGAGFDDAYGKYVLDREEFYNANVTSRAVSLIPRDCQQTMYRMRARRDDGHVIDPSAACSPPGRSRSPLDGVPVGVSSTAFAASKPLLGSEDFVWGFHPIAFRLEGVRSTLSWILRDRWQLTGR